MTMFQSKICVIKKYKQKFLGYLLFNLSFCISKSSVNEELKMTQHCAAVKLFLQLTIMSPGKVLH